MTLTLGTGPFGQTPAGVFNDAVTIDGRVIWWEDSPRRIQGSWTARWWSTAGE